MKRYIITGILGLMVLSALNSCKKYLDVVPEGVATLNNAFALRAQAEKFLFTCYSFMPKDASVANNPALVGGDEIWRGGWAVGTLFDIAKGLQNKVSPYGDVWQPLYQGIRDCNIFLDNIAPVPDMPETEKKQWIAEVKFLKAYYYFCLVRQYGPVPLIKTNLPVTVGIDQAQVSRTPVDSCFKYIAQLIDEAAPDLPLTIDNPSRDAGRITKPIALACKAKALVYAASPLFNGNADEAGLKNPDGTPLFNTTFSQAKWDSAAAACKQAIDICNEAGFRWYNYQQDFQQYNLTDTIQTQMNIRNSFCQKWNSSVIWANAQSNVTGGLLEQDPGGPSSLQNLVMPQINPAAAAAYVPRGEFSPPLKIAEMFYTSHGVPIDEDKTWDYSNRYTLRVAGDDDDLYIRAGYTTAYLNFNREPRFYADLGFDGGIWYGQGQYDDSKPSNLYYVQAKYGQANGASTNGSTVTGYYIKKYTHYQNVIGNQGSYSTHNYPWPVIRLSGLYLLYAEALNEANGPGPEVYQYLDSVRSRAGLPSVESAWTNYSINPAKYTTQQGLRDIIHRERMIELAFEGQRFWDLRRWKEAPAVMNSLIRGWDLFQKETAYYYRPVTIFKQSFGLKDYFFPILDGEITKNKNLVQNLGW